jgi:hypothetical protein
LLNGTFAGLLLDDGRAYTAEQVRVIGNVTLIGFSSLEVPPAAELAVEGALLLRNSAKFSAQSESITVGYDIDLSGQSELSILSFGGATVSGNVIATGTARLRFEGGASLKKRVSDEAVSKMAVAGELRVLESSELVLNEGSIIQVGTVAELTSRIVIQPDAPSATNNTTTNSNSSSTYVEAEAVKFGGELVVAAAFDTSATAPTTITIPVATFTTTDGSQFESVTYQPEDPCQTGTATPQYNDRRLDVLITLDNSGCGEKIVDPAAFPPWAIAVAAVGGAIVVTGAVLGIVFGSKKCRKVAMPYRGTAD